LKWKQEAYDAETSQSAKEAMKEELEAFKQELKDATNLAKRARDDNEDIARQDAKEAEAEIAKAKAEANKKQDKERGDGLKKAFDRVDKVK